MFRGNPVSNKKLSKVWSEIDLNKHMQNVRNIKSRVDFRPPSQYSHLKYKAKSLIQQEERFLEIDRENQMLLKKIKNLSVNSGGKKKISVVGRSLNHGSRKRKLLEIAIENQAMVQRINSKKSVYNSQNFKFQRKNIEKMLGNICEYPYTLGSSQKIPSLHTSHSKKFVTSNSLQKCEIFSKKILLDHQKFRIKILQTQS